MHHVRFLYFSLRTNKDQCSRTCAIYRVIAGTYTIFSSATWRNEHNNKAAVTNPTGSVELPQNQLVAIGWKGLLYFHSRGNMPQVEYKLEYVKNKIRIWWMYYTTCIFFFLKEHDPMHHSFMGGKVLLCLLDTKMDSILGCVCEPEHQE
jgi:hypothetical protein